MAAVCFFCPTVENSSGDETEALSAANTRATHMVRIVNKIILIINLSCFFLFKGGCKSV